MAAIGQFSEKSHQDTYYDRHKRTMSLIKLILSHFNQGGWTAAKIIHEPLIKWSY